METISTPKVSQFASTFPSAGANRRCTASYTTPTASTRSRPVSASARDGFDLAMPVMMFFVGWLVGGAHCKIGEDGGACVEHAVAGFGEQRERARHKPRGELAEREHGAGENGGERRLLLQLGIR